MFKDNQDRTRLGVLLSGGTMGEGWNRKNTEDVARQKENL